MRWAVSAGERLVVLVRVRDAAGRCWVVAVSRGVGEPGWHIVVCRVARVERGGASGGRVLSVVQAFARDWIVGEGRTAVPWVVAGCALERRG